SRTAPARWLTKRRPDPSPAPVMPTGASRPPVTRTRCSSAGPLTSPRLGVGDGDALTAAEALGLEVGTWLGVAVGVLEQPARRRTAHAAEAMWRRIGCIAPESTPRPTARLHWSSGAPAACPMRAGCVAAMATTRPPHTRATQAAPG